VSDVTGWVAIEKGAPIVTLMDDSVTPIILAAKADIKRCEDLSGRRVAIPNLAGGKAFMLRRYLEMRCPAAKPELLVVAGEAARLAGIMAGELDAAVMDLETLDRIDGSRRSGWHSLVAFAEEFPGLTALSLFARREVTEKSPAMVKDWLRAVLVARRRLQDPGVLSGELVARLGMAPALAEKAAVEYLDGNYWDVNGRYTSDSLQNNIDFAIAASSLKPGTKASDLADLSFLNAVLDEIGRK
jgi:hypothetical protein